MRAGCHGNRPLELVTLRNGFLPVPISGLWPVFITQTLWSVVSNKYWTWKCLSGAGDWLFLRTMKILVRLALPFIEHGLTTTEAMVNWSSTTGCVVKESPGKRALWSFCILHHCIASHRNWPGGEGCVNLACPPLVPCSFNSLNASIYLSLT